MDFINFLLEVIWLVFLIYSEIKYTKIVKWLNIMIILLKLQTEDYLLADLFRGLPGPVPWSVSLSIQITWYVDESPAFIPFRLAGGILKQVQYNQDRGFDIQCIIVSFRATNSRIWCDYPFFSCFLPGGSPPGDPPLAGKQIQPTPLQGGEYGTTIYYIIPVFLNDFLAQEFLTETPERNKKMKKTWSREYMQVE